MKDKLHVLIIGGGIAGPALALFLKKACHTSAVYEAYGESRGVGGGLGLAPNGMNIVAALEAADALKARGSLVRESMFRDERGRLLARLPNDEAAYGQPLMSMMRSDVYAVVADEMRAQNIPIHYRKRLMRVDQPADKVIAHFADGSRAEGDLLVGADGVHSQTRAQIMPDAPKPEFVGITGMGGALPRTAVPGLLPRDTESMTFTFGPRGFFGHCGGSRGEVMWWSNLPRHEPYSVDELKSLSSDRIRQELLERFSDYYKPIPTLIERTDNMIAHNIFDIASLPCWHAGRVVLIGDAAHAVSPNSGQGASLALEDAMYLAKMLRDCADYRKAFAAFEHDRKPRVERIVAAGRRAASDKTEVSPFASKIRNGMIAMMIRLFGIPGQHKTFGYRIAWEPNASDPTPPANHAGRVAA